MADRIVVLDGHTLNPGDNPWDPVSKLGELIVHDRTPVDEIISRAAEARIVLTNKTPLSAQSIAALPQLKFISIMATGYNNVDIAAARSRGIPVSNVPVYGTDSVAQFVFAQLLELCHNVGANSRAVQDGQWTRSKDFSFWQTPLVELRGKTIGIIGFGRIGRRVGEIAQAFGMTVMATRPSRPAEPLPAPFVWADLPTIARAADVISLHAPLTQTNRHMIDRQIFDLMKPTAFLINTARGGLVSEPDLIDALNAGRIAGAALDVIGVEPMEAGNPLLNAKNCFITPHIAWATLEARQRAMAATAQNVAAFQAGHPINVVNAV